MLVFVLYIILLYLLYYCPLEKSICYLVRNRGVDADEKGSGEEVGLIERGKTVIRTHYMRKKYLFNKRKKIHFLT